MYYKTEIEINKPLEKVIELFDSEENMYKWMKGLQSIETIEGQKGEVNSKAKMKFKMGKREVEMTETILAKNFPHEFTASYTSKGVYNVVKNTFEKISEDKTLYRTDNEFQFTGMLKILAFLMPGAFKKQSMKYCSDFKNFVENAD